jgi:hypothetical protein
MVLVFHVLQNRSSTTNLADTLLGSFNTGEISGITGAWSFTHFGVSRLGSSENVTVKVLFRVKN